MYRIKSTGELKTQGEVRQMFKNTSLPKVWDDAVCNALGIDVVFEAPTPQVTRYQTYSQQGAEQINGKWYKKYIVVDMDDEAKASVDAQAAKAVRDSRDRLLTDSDWTQVADAPVDKAAWATYRQALRDVPTQAGFPHNVTWPNKPE